MLHRHQVIRLILIACWLISPAIESRSQTGTDSLDQALARYFKDHPAELFRYAGLATYGEEAVPFDPGRIETELDLLKRVRRSELMEHPTENVWALCHNVLTHDPSAGQEFLSALNTSVADRDTLNHLFLELLFAGEFGERMAVNNLRYDVENSNRPWATFLSRNAIYTSSIPAIEQELRTSKDTLVEQLLLSALSYIGDPRSQDLVGRMIEEANDDGVQAKAIFAYTELAGYDGLMRLEQVKTIGPRSEEEKAGSVDWLKKETGPENKFGTEVTSDIAFIERFGDIRSPVMIWLEKEGLLDEKKAAKGVQLTSAKKNELLDLLVRSKGFGLEAVKGSLFKSLEANDEEKLLQLRSACFYSPNSQTRGRVNTIGIMIRHLRKQAN